MAALPAENLWDADAFLTWERNQEYKHELIDNHVYAMAGASRGHNRINLNLAFTLTNKLGGKGCEVYAMDMRVEVKRQATYAYPDVVVVCGEPKFRNNVKPDTLKNPTLIFEILSPSTELIDRNRKLDQYLELESVQAYFLVSQHKPRIEAYSRLDDGWRYQDLSGLDAALVIDVPACELPLADIYRNLRFEPIAE